MSRMAERPIGYHVIYDETQGYWDVLNRNSYVVARCSSREMAKRVARLLDEDSWKKWGLT